jgi:hypothetical protein
MNIHGKSQETLVQEMLDREIRTLPARYCDCVWQRTWTTTLICSRRHFRTDDPTPRGKGRGAEKMIGGRWTLKPRPFIHNHVVELLGPDRAKGTCYVEVRMRDGKSG